ncbi:MAG: GntR family transcriptional regulator [Oscillospiraceae bacterium]|nr:GntR family transcriptional regulator [Oscillospiraceae bacterium]
MVHLDYRDARPIYAQLISGFQEQIVSGILQPGDKLPSVRELAGQLAINPNTIQRAYRELEHDGWIATVAGKGCFVCDVPQKEETEDWLAQFDKAVAALLKTGMTREELMKRLEKGGNENAGSL